MALVNKLIFAAIHLYKACRANVLIERDTQGRGGEVFTDRWLLMGLASVVLLLASSCARFLDVEVTNPCDVGGLADFATGKEPPSDAKILRSLDDDLLSTMVPAGATAFFIGGELSGDLPFEGGYGIIRWNGEANYSLFQLEPTNVEPVPALIPERLCPR